MSSENNETSTFDRVAKIIEQSLHRPLETITWDSALDSDLGAESLDLIEITMELEAEFNIWLPEKSILDTAAEVFGRNVLYQGDVLLPAGRMLIERRLEDSEPELLAKDPIRLKDLSAYFLKVGSWVKMVDGLLEYTPTTCPSCQSAQLKPANGFRLKCQECATEIPLRCGEDINRAWVKQFYDNEYLPLQAVPTQAEEVLAAGGAAALCSSD